MKLARWILVIGIICGAVLIAGYRLTRTEIDASAAVPAPAPAKASLSVQATTVEEVEARRIQPVSNQTAVFEDTSFGYQIQHPLDWETAALSDQMVSFQSPDGLTQVKVEAVGPLPADGLSPFVDRSLGTDAVLSRQLLTIHGIQAERVITFADAIEGQATTFYLDGGNSAFVLTGIGDQHAIEMIARSFTMPQLVAQR